MSLGFLGFSLVAFGLVPWLCLLLLGFPGFLQAGPGLKLKNACVFNLICCADNKSIEMANRNFSSLSPQFCLFVEIWAKKRGNIDNKFLKPKKFPKTVYVCQHLFSCLTMLHFWHECRRCRPCRSGGRLTMALVATISTVIFLARAINVTIGCR